MGNWEQGKKGAVHDLLDMTGRTQRRMRKMLSVILAVLMILVSPLEAIPAKAATVLTDGKGISYEVYDENNKYVTIKECPTSVAGSLEYGYTGEIKLSDNNTYTIKKVEDRAFAGSQITSIQFPPTIIEYGTDILKGCNNLTYIENASDAKLYLPDLGETTTDAWYYNLGGGVCPDYIPYSFSNRTADYVNKTSNKAWIITFNANGGKIKGQDSITQRVVYGRYIQEPTEKPIRENYEFSYWCEYEAAGAFDFTGKTVNEKFPSANEKTLSASWKNNDTDAKYELEDGWDNYDVTIDAAVLSGTSVKTYFAFTPSTTDKYTFSTNINTSFNIYLYGPDSKTTAVGTTKTKSRSDTLQAGKRYYYMISNSTTTPKAEKITFKSAGSTTTTKKVTDSACVITLSPSSFTYSGSACVPTVTVKYDGTTLTKDQHYTLTYSNNTNAGTASVTIAGKGDYSGSTTKNFTINKKAISACTVSLDKTSYDYTGNAVVPVVKVTDGSKTLTEKTDYTLAYSNNTNAGTASVTVTGTGNYTGSKSSNFTINKIKAPNPPTSITAVNGETTVGAVSLAEYDGWSWHTSDRNINLEAGKTVTARAVYKDTTNYTDTTVNVSIEKPAVKLDGIILSEENISLEVGGKRTLTVSPNPSGASLGNVTWTSSDATVASVSGTSATTTVTALKKGNATITVKAGGFSKTCTVEVTKPAELNSNKNEVKFTEEYGYSNPGSDSITITNNGDAVAEKVSANLQQGSYFKITSTLGSSIAAGKSGSVTITPVSGLAVGTYNDKLEVSYGSNKSLIVNVSLTVGVRKITVTANDQTITYGDTIQPLTGTLTAGTLVAGDSLDQIVTYDTDATPTPKPDAGNYTISVTKRNTATNYDVKEISGKLIVNKKKVTAIQFPTATGIKSNQTLAASTLSGGDTTYGDFDWENKWLTPSRGAAVPVKVVLTLSTDAKKNYSFDELPEGYTYDSAKGTITKEITISVVRDNLPGVIFPTATDLEYGDELGKSDLTGGSTELGDFDWKDGSIVMDKTGTFTYEVVFRWNNDSKTKYQLAEDEMEIIEGVSVTVRKKAETRTPDQAELIERTSGSVRVNQVVEYQYRLTDKNGQTVRDWQDSAEFTGLSAGTLYKVYTRYRATETHEASAESAPYSVYTLATDPYTIDISQLNTDGYIETLYTEYFENGNKHATVSYSNNQLTLKDNSQKYTLTGYNPNLTVKAEGSYCIIDLNGASINKLDIAGADITVGGNVTVADEIVSNTYSSVNISVSGNLTVRTISVPYGTLTITGKTLNIGTPVPGNGKAGISAKKVVIKDSTVTATGGSSAPAIEGDDVTITDSTVTATGGDGEPAIKGNDNVKITGGTVTATGGAGASAVQGGSITLADTDLKVEAGSDPNVPAIKSESGDIFITGNTTVKSDTSKGNLYSDNPKGEGGEDLDMVTVTFEGLDGEEIDSVTVTKGGTMTLPEIQMKEAGYQMGWKDRAGNSYKVGDSVTVTGDMVFIVEKNPILVTGITMTPKKATIGVGEDLTLAVMIEPKDALDGSVTWSSDKPSVAKVDSKSGKVTGVAAGTAVITAKTNDGSNISGTCTITVTSGQSATTEAPNEVKVNSIKITGATKKVAPGKKLTLKATVYPSNAANKDVTWTVNNSKYASVSSKGVVTAKKAGKGKTVTVTAVSKADSSKKATYKISIMKKAVTKIKLSASKTTLKKGKSVTIKAKLTPSSGISKELTWTSSNTKVATVSSKGKVKAKKKGKAKITAKAKDGSGKKATITIAVK